MSPRRRSRRERIALRLPATVMEYPFEVFVGVYGVLAAAAILVGGGVPKSMAALVPVALIVAWGASLGLGGATVLVGLRLRRNHFVIAMGLRLVAGALATFVLAASWFTRDPTIIPSALLVTFVAVLAGFRSFYLRTNALLAHTITEKG